MHLTLPLSLGFLIANCLVAAQTTHTPSPSITISGGSTGISPTVSGSSTITSSVSGSVNVSASSTTTSYPSLSTVSACVSGCLAVAASAANCTSVVDVNCYCVWPNSATFQQSIVDCVTSQCITDLSTAENLSLQFCKASNATSTLTFPPLPSTTSGSSTASASSSVTSPASSISQSASATASKSAASRLEYGRSREVLLAAGAGALGLVIGAFCL
ncbi:hypothetical protein JAAARDRAFT_208141 [Jaapia argillacea MUCL 33604]|uniref:CFEM domain-containing protein n=1 Tax=Jaapia argillacea MUCL 33604 TaxID=933084 RepID=A0A067PRL7_9AGAM|nr:hypothetical protein JAAARDRAFT_208141 [Jaapia argillacea MUCL 33604]